MLNMFKMVLNIFCDYFDEALQNRYFFLSFLIKLMKKKKAKKKKAPEEISLEAYI